MKIAFTSVEGGGLDSYVRTAARWLSERKHTVHIVYVQRLVYQAHAPTANISIHHAPVGNLHYYLSRLHIFSTPIVDLVRSLESTASVAKVLKRLRANNDLDLAEIHTGGPPFIFGDVPFVYKMHGDDWVIRHYCEDGSSSMYAKIVQRKTMLAAKKVFAVSRSQADFIAGACNFPPRLISVLPLPIDLTSVNQTPRFNSRPPYHLMCVGRLEKRKGIDTLVQALRTVWSLEPETYLHLFGAEGDLRRAQIEQLAPEHQGRIIFEGFVTHEKVLDKYCYADLYVSATRYESNGGYAIQEALSRGLAVIATDIGPVPELVRHGETGWLFPRDDSEKLAETIVFALRHPETRGQYGQAARRFCQRFDIERIMTRQLELYRQAASYTN